MGLFDNIRKREAATRRRNAVSVGGATVDNRWLQRYAAGRATGSQNLLNQGLRNLKGVGTSDLDAWFSQFGDVAAEEWLGRLASAGPKAARRAARYESMIGEGQVEKAGRLAKIRTADDIARTASSLEERFLGYGLDINSPSVQAALSDLVQTRGVAATEAGNRIDENIALGKAAARAGGLTPDALIDMGDTEFAMDRLHDEERNLTMARRGRVFGSALGTMVAGPGGYAAGGQVGYDLSSLLYD